MFKTVNYFNDYLPVAKHSMFKMINYYISYLPVGPVRDQSKIRQGFLWTANLPLVLRQEVGEVDEEPTIAFALKEEVVI